MAASIYPEPAIDFDDHVGALSHRTEAELRAALLVLRTIRNPWLMRMGRTAARVGLALHFPGTVGAIERTVFRLFCGGTSLEEAIVRAGRLSERHIGTILDYAVEGEDSEKDFDNVTEELARVVEVTAKRPEVAFAAVKVSGIARFSLLESISAKRDLNDDDSAEFERAVHRLDRIASQAHRSGAAVFVDAEHSWIQPAIDSAVESLMQTHNQERAVVHTTIQLYLRDGYHRLEQAIKRARDGGYKLGVKIVRGAYMKRENERAVDNGVDSPIHPSKGETDRAYDEALTLCLENIEICSVCAATHNIPSTRHLLREMARLGIVPQDPRVTTSQLLGMFDRITVPLAEHGYNALKYVPYGGVRDTFPYLLRRAAENESVADQLGAELEAVRTELHRRGHR